jgi:hypothetical protein
MSNGSNLRIHEILVRIRIRGSILQNNGSGSCYFRQCRGIITATSQAKLEPPPPTALLRMRAGQLTYVPLFHPSARQPKYMYSTLLLLSLFRRYHVCLRHISDLQDVNIFLLINPTFERYI